jgi:hypothetical protein
MFILFAYDQGLKVKLRPSLFPYLCIGHALIDMTTVVMILTL